VLLVAREALASLPVKRYGGVDRSDVACRSGRAELGVPVSVAGWRSNVGSDVGIRLYYVVVAGEAP
jgi:hypothetical protein